MQALQVITIPDKASPFRDVGGDSVARQPNAPFMECLHPVLESGARHRASVASIFTALAYRKLAGFRTSDNLPKAIRVYAAPRIGNGITFSPALRG